MYKTCFNQNYTSLVAATSTEFRLFNLENVDTAVDVKQVVQKSGIRLIEGLWNESICVIVMESTPKILILWNLRRQVQESCYNYLLPVLAVKVNRKYVMTLCETSISIHNVKNISYNVRTHYIPLNPECVWDFSNRSPIIFYLGYKYYGSETERKLGIIQVFEVTPVDDDINVGRVVSNFVANSKPLAAMAFSASGREIVSSNTSGRLIQVHDTLSGFVLAEFRRGIFNVTISSLVFSSCGEYIVSASNRKRVHVYRMNVDESTTQIVFKLVRSMLPTITIQNRAIATIDLPEAGIGRAFGICKLSYGVRLMVATIDGYLHVYSISIATKNVNIVNKSYHLQEDILELTVDLAFAEIPFIDDDDYDDGPSTSAAAALRALRSPDSDSDSEPELMLHRIINPYAVIYNVAQ